VDNNTDRGERIRVGGVKRVAVGEEEPTQGWLNRRIAALRLWKEKIPTSFYQSGFSVVNVAGALYILHLRTFHSTSSFRASLRFDSHRFFITFRHGPAGEGEHLAADD